MTARLLGGWEDDLGSDDTWLLAAARNHARFYDEMAQAMGWSRPSSPWLAGGASGLGSPFANLTALRAPATEPEGAEALAAASELARQAQAPLLVVSPWPTADLSGEGFHPVGHPPLLVRAAGGAVPEPPAELVVERVTDAAGLAAFEQAVVEGYPVPELAGLAPGTAFGPALLDTGWAFFVGRVDGRAVCTAAGHVSDGVQVVEIVSTLADHRGRGYGEAVTWAATRIEPELPALLVASDLGRPVYERMGYQALCRFTFWVALPG